MIEDKLDNSPKLFLHVFIFLLIVFMDLIFPSIFLNMMIATKQQNEMVILTLIFIISYLVAIYGLWKIARIEKLFLQSWQKEVVVMFVGPVLLLGANMIGGILSQGPSSNNATLDNWLSGSNKLILISMILMVGIFSPIVEELIFRGVFNHWFFISSWKLQLLISSALFAFVHEQDVLVSFLIYFVLGIILWLIRNKYGIGMSIWVHVINNSLFLLVALLY